MGCNNSSPIRKPHPYVAQQQHASDANLPAFGSQQQQQQQQQQSTHHPAMTNFSLLSCVSRFACNNIQSTIIFSQVHPTWCEALTDPEWGSAGAIFERLAYNLSEQQAKYFWNDAFAILKASDNTTDRGLVNSLSRFIDTENERALGDTVVAKRKHRMLQQQGTFLVAFRNCRDRHWSWNMHLRLSMWQKIICDGSNDNCIISKINTKSEIIYARPRADTSQEWHLRGGTVDFAKLPSTVREVHLEGNHLCGPIVANSKHSCLTVLNLQRNEFKSINSRTLPDSLRVLNLASNNLSGSLDWLSELPPSIEELVLSHNRFDWVAPGTLDRARLPECLLRLEISHNQLSSSSVDISQLPDSLVVLDLSHNRLSSSSVDISQLPRGLEVLDLSHNQLSSSSVDISQLPRELEVLGLSHNRLGGGISLGHLPPTLRALELNDNMLSGAVDFRALRRSRLCHLHLNGNRRLTGVVEMGLLSAELQDLNVSNTNIEVILDE